MPRVSVWMIRLSLLHFSAAAIVGAVMLASKATGAFTPVLHLVPAHLEMMLVGWMVQLVIGTAFWILPREAGAARDAGSGRLWVILVLLNAGVFAAGHGIAAGDASVWLAGRVAEAAAVALFLPHAWNRQRAWRPSTRRQLV